MCEMPKSFREFLRKSDSSRPSCPEVATLQKEFADEFGLEVSCLSCDDPLNGEVGYVFFKTITPKGTKEGQEKMVTVTRRFGPKAENVRLKTMSEMEKEYDRATERDLPVRRHDDPMRMMLGFIVSGASGRTWYNISLRDLKETIKAGG